MVTMMAVSLLSLLILGVANGSAMGDIGQVLVAVSAIVLVVSRLAVEQDLETPSEIPPPHRS